MGTNTLTPEAVVAEARELASGSGHCCGTLAGILELTESLWWDNSWGDEESSAYTCGTFDWTNPSLLEEAVKVWIGDEDTGNLYGWAYEKSYYGFTSAEYYTQSRYDEVLAELDAWEESLGEEA